MTLKPQEFMRRFLLHVLPSGLHRIRHFGLLANGNRRECLATARAALHASVEVQDSEPTCADLPKATGRCRTNLN